MLYKARKIQDLQEEILKGMIASLSRTCDEAIPLTEENLRTLFEMSKFPNYEDFCLSLYKMLIQDDFVYITTENGIKMASTKNRKARKIDFASLQQELVSYFK